jgi:phage protein D
MSAAAASTTAWVPALEVSVAGADLDFDVSKSIADVQISLASDAIDQATSTLANPAPELRFTHRPAARLFLEGSSLQIRLGYVDDLTTLFDGEVTGSAPTFPDSGVPTVTVEASSRLHWLTVPPRTERYTDKTDGQIARAVADRNSLGADVDEPPGATQHPLVVQFQQDDLAFMRARARATSCELAAEGSTLRFGPAGDGRPPAATLVWNDPQLAAGAIPLLRFQPRFDPKRAVTRVVVSGTDPLTGKRITGRAGPGDEASSAPGRTTAAECARKVFHEDRVLTVGSQPVLTTQEADTLARALFRERSQQLVQATAAIVGTPEVRPGATVEVLGVGPRFSGTYYVTRTVHTVGAGGYRTTLTLRCGDVGDLP